jgi:hypothetical protein
MKSKIIKCDLLINNSTKITFGISKEVLKDGYIKYLNKRRKNNLPVEEDLKLITFVGQAFLSEFEWAINRQIKDPIVKELFN